MPELTKLTGDVRRPAQLLYFTTSSVTVDGRHLVAVRESADGNPNIVSLNLKTNVERELSLNRDGTLKSYVYFRGNPLRGLGKASMHDIGKTGLPAEILLKPSKLSPDERLRVESHSELGATIVDQIEFLKTVTPVILHHHERWDGSGYPHGLSGDSIPLLARILAVADSYDAMTTKRSYSEKLSRMHAREQLELGAGTQYDPRVVAALLEALERTALAGATGLLSQTARQGRPDLLS